MLRWSEKRALRLCACKSVEHLYFRASIIRYDILRKTLILVNNVIYNEKYSTGMCAFTRAKEPFQAAFIAMGVVKKSIFSRIINKG